MLGTIVNTVAIIIGTLLGVALGIRVQKKYVKIVMKILGIITIFLGVQMLIEFRGLLAPFASLTFGGLAGYLLRIDRAINSFVVRFSRNNLGGRGFVTASVLFCVGPMSIVGSLEDGLRSNPSILLTKSGLDGISSVIFGATFGISVIFSAVLVFALQGSITIMSSYASASLTQYMMGNLTATGGVLVLMIAANLLGYERVKVENLLPSLFLVAMISNFLPNLP